MPFMNSLSTRISNSQRDRSRLGRRQTAWGGRSSRPQLELLEERTLLSTFTVTDKSDSPSDTGSLRYGVLNEPNGTVIHFASNVTGTITLTNGVLAINRNLKIEGPGAAILTISADHSSSVFGVSRGVTATISGLTIADGRNNAGGGIDNGGMLKLADDVFDSNSATGVGGAIFEGTSGSLSVTGCTLNDNRAPSGSGGGIYVRGGMMTIQGSTLESNQSGEGGGIYNDGTMSLTNCTVSGNSTPSVGGGIENPGTLTVTDSTVSSNTATSDGGGIDNGGSATLGNTIVADNSLTGGGSGPDFNGTVTTDAGNNLIGNDSGASGFSAVSGDLLNVNPLLAPLKENGGPTQTMGLMPGSPAIDAGNNALIPSGIATDQRGFPRIVNGAVDIGAFEVQVYLVLNTADHGAGSLRTAMTNANQAGGSTIYFVTSGVITLASALPAITSDVYMDGSGANVLTVSGNGAYQVFDVQSGVNATISGLTIADGSSATSGGGIENDGTLSLTNCTVSNSSATTNGGGIDNQGTLTVTTSTVSGNTATSDGGGIENDGTLTLVNSTLASNTADSGGGIENTAAATMSSIDSAIADNSAAGNGGGIDNGNGGSATLANTIVAYNTLTAAGLGPDYRGSVIDPGNNLIGDDSGSNGFTQPTDLLNVDPLLSPLGFYGGPTETLALLPGSPAIDAGNNALIPPGITTDQRGLPRIANGIVDIGAFECPGFTITVVSGNNQQTLVNTSFASSLVVLVTSNHGDPVSGGVVTFSPPGSGASASFPGGRDTATTSVFGVARINVAANTIAGGYSLGVAARGASATSFSLTNTPGPADKVAFLLQPTDTNYGNTISPAVTVEVVDQFNNLVNSTASITVALGTNPTGASLGGTLVVNAVAGIAPFSDLTVSEVGTGYTLAATSPGLIAAPPSSSFNITPRPITVTAAANTKTYDGTSTASAAPTITSGNLVNGDTANFTEAYATRNAGTGLTLTPSGTVNDGNGGLNYNVTFDSVSTGVITAEALTITAVANTKTYNGTTSAAAVPTITSGSLQGSDTADFIETYGTRNVGLGLTLMPSGTVNDGNGGNNYTYTFDSVSAGVVTAEALTITAVANTKSYDGTTSAAAVPTITSGSLGTGDTANFIETYSTRNVGIGLTLTPSGTVNDGNGGNNYTYTFDSVSTGVITAEALTITAVANTKTYDGTTSAVVIPTITSGSLGTGDTANFIETYSTHNVGTGLTLTPSGTVNDGNGGNNYTYTFDPMSTGVITAEALTITAVANTKVYDGTTSAAAIPTITSGSLQGSDTADFIETYGTRNVGTGLTLTPTGTVNDGNGGNNYTYMFDSVSTGVITAEALTITAVANTKTYNGTTSAAAVPTITSGSLQGSDTADFIETYGTRNVGTGLTLTPSGTVNDGNGGNNYTYMFDPVSTGVITAEALTITAVANTKTYNGTTSAVAVPTITSGSLGIGDTANFVETYSTRNVGTGLTLTPSGTVNDGNGGNNYTYTFDPVSTGAITAEALTITAVANTKVYDGTTIAAAVPTITSGSLQGPDTANFVETYSTRNVGTGLALTPSGTVNDGNGGNNYTYTFDPVSTGVITAEALTITAVANTKTYNGTTSAAAVPTITSGSLQGSDTADFIETYGTRNVGTGLTLTPSGTVNDGNGGNNYTYTFDSVSTGVITAEALTITAVANAKTYDGTTSAAAVPTITSGNLGTGDTPDFLEIYSTRNVGTGLTLTPSGTVNDGNGGNNYTYTFDPVSTGVITAEALTITAVANTKVYDGTTSAAAIPTITTGSLGTGDTANFIETYSTHNVGTGLTLTPSGTVNDGNGGNNYTYTFDPVSTGGITAEALTITAVANTKVYDGTTTAAAVPTITSGSLQGSDTANFVETYSTRNVGTGLTLTPSGTVNDGNGGSNYTYTFDPVSTGVITAEALTITAVANTKTYDGTTSAAAVPTITSGSLGTGDTANFVETYSTRNVGIGLMLTPSGTVNDGNGGNNYTYTFDPVSTGVITAEALTITGVANTKTYDGTTSAAAIPTITSGSLGTGDTADFIETYSTHNVGTGLTLTPSGTVNDGNGGNNYTYTFDSVATGAITTAALTITAVTNTKVYDGTRSAAAIPTVSGLQGSDMVSDLSETYVTANVGTGKTLSVATYSVNDGNGGNNYTVTTVPNQTGVITPVALVITAVANAKVYDGTTTAAALPTITSGSLQGSDTADFIETYNTRNVGTGLTLTPSGTVNDGNGGNNYTYTFDSVSTGVITQAALTITAVTNTKVYDGTTSAAAIPAVSGLQGTDTVTNLSETYDTPAIGTGKTLTVTTYTVNDGNGGNNYTVTTVANQTGVILASIPSALLIYTQPSATATAGQVFPAQPVIYVLNQVGNLDTGDNTSQVTVTLRVGAGPLLGTTTVTVSGGIATFTNLADDKAESIILVFTAPGLVKAQANSTTVNPAAASRLSVTAPATATAGRPFTITVTAFDPYNNVATGYRGKIYFTSSDNRATFPSVYTFTSGDGGVRTFGNGVTLRTSGNQTIAAYDVVHPSIIGSTSVDVGRGALESVVAIAGAGGSVGGQVRETIRALARRSKPRAALRAASQPTTAEAVRARAIARADAARDRVLAELEGNLHAYLVAERLAGRRLD